MSNDTTENQGPLTVPAICPLPAAGQQLSPPVPHPSPPPFPVMPCSLVPKLGLLSPDGAACWLLILMGEKETEFTWAQVRAFLCVSSL